MSLLSKIWKEKNVLALSSQVIHAGIGFLTFIILTRTYPKEVFGKWVLYVTAIAFIEMFRFGLTRTAMVRFLSGANEQEAKQLNGSNWKIGIVVSIIICVLIAGANLIFNQAIQNSGYLYFFSFYPIMTFANLPYNNAITLLQARQRFDRLLLIRNLPLGLFLLIAFLNLLFWHMDLRYLVIIHIAIFALMSLISSIFNWNAINSIGSSSREKIKQILDFGKYSTGTLIGNNLLKSADTFIIGLSAFLGPAGVAFYSIPLKLTEVMEIPLQSFAATAFPKMSKASLSGDNHAVKQLFYANAGGITWLFIPFLIVCFLLAKPLVLLLGGQQYVESYPIFRVFCLYGLMLPLDRFIGVSLDSINKPKSNFFKVIYMASANIIGDLIAVFVLIKIFPEISMLQILLMVSVVTILMKITGVTSGWYYLRKQLDVNMIRLIKEGYWFYRENTKRVLKMLKNKS